MNRSDVKKQEQYLESTLRMGYFPPEVGHPREYLNDETFREVAISLSVVKGLLGRFRPMGAILRYQGYHLGNGFDTFLLT